MKKWQEYEEHADLKTIYGANRVGNKWIVNLWHPFARNVELIIFDKDDQNKEIKTIKGRFELPNWKWELEDDLDGYYYQYRIEQENGAITYALDPYAKSMASFNWEGHNRNVGKAAFVKINKIKKLYKLNKINEPQPILYEAHVRDLTSLREDVEIPGSFNALKEIKFAEHLRDLNITHIQFLPIHNCYTLDESDKIILKKGMGQGWGTNYNWGYDPHNYFSINGWYSSNPKNPYSRIDEFKELVNYMHSNNIKVINDVVYNHMFHNSILNNIIPGYYFREGSEIKPVDQPAFASERLMARRIIIDSLKHFVECYDVDGFRFDLSCFTDKITIEKLTKELRAIKPNIILHGEAWPWSDLSYDDAMIKGHSDNEIDFGYFNDTTRNAIKGEDDGEGFALGVIGGNLEEFPNYLAGIIGNIKESKFNLRDISNTEYTRFTNNTSVLLNYTACHDGHTMWDKVNLTVEGDKETKFEYYRQVIMMQQFLQGRTLFLEGTELLYTKPNDVTGQDSERSHKTDLAIDIFNLGTTEFNENTYKTTDYVNGLRWDNLQGEVKKHIHDFISKINKFRLSTKYFNLKNAKEINEAYEFIYTSKDEGVIDFRVETNDGKIRVIHNFKDTLYKYESNGKILFDNKIKQVNKIGELQGNSTILIQE
ncbi:alpha-amylase family glycosyl hydrolase [Mycoplasma todarodis]|uniref:Alpha-amylase n=1 Tax=Mycoplasma todarodis TaxID=1937191 RepID=A0A4R0XT65_9MOLU|nr:alpha-amylase family glycosyl hydrolase [Mycoplasma todarodis]TCG11660.1 alpha-amylase [Mycoplasma todarodis]